MLNIEDRLNKIIMYSNGLVKNIYNRELLEHKAPYIFLACTKGEAERVIKKCLREQRSHYYINPFNHKDYTFNPFSLDLETLLQIIRRYEFDFSAKHDSDYYEQVMFLKNAVILFKTGFPGKQFTLNDLYLFSTNTSGYADEILKSVEASQDVGLIDACAYFDELFKSNNECCNAYKQLAPLRYIIKSLLDTTNSQTVKNYINIKSVVKDNNLIIICVDEKEYGDEGLLLAMVIIEAIALEAKCKAGKL